MNRTGPRGGCLYPIGLALLLWGLIFMAGHAAFAQTPTPVTPGYQICITTDPGNTRCSFQPTDLTHGLPVNLVAGSVTASLAPFTPLAAGSRMTPLAVTTADSSGTLPVGAQAVVVTNVGVNPMYCNVAGVAATTSDQYISASGGWFVFAPGVVTTLHCIATGGSTTANGIGGTGLPAGTGGGASAGGGGAITAAINSYAAGALSAGAGVDGWDLTQGTKTDAACAGDNTSGCSVEARLQRIAQNLSTLNTTAGQPIPVGANTIGNTVNAPTGNSAQALTDVVCGAAVSSCVLKASAGNFYGVYAECTAACWLMVFNATSLPANGATTAGKASGNLVDCISLTGAAGGSKSIAYTTFPVAFSVGITVAISSTACSSLTASTVGFIHGTVL